MTKSTEELVAIMKAGSKPKEVVMKAEDNVPAVVSKAAAKSVMGYPESKVTINNLTIEEQTLAILQNINAQLTRVTELLTQIRNISLNQPSSYKTPEERSENGEIL